MNVSNGRVEAVDSKMVNTKYGSKNVYSAKVDGQWYKFGFKNPNLNAGDVVSFDFLAGTYGNEVNSSTLKKSEATAQPAAAPAAPTQNTFRSNKGSFPIDALDGQRSIVRQNALTNARETIVASYGGKPFALELDNCAGVIIALAKRFEAYTAGDMDMEMAKASLAGEQPTTKH